MPASISLAMLVSFTYRATKRQRCQAITSCSMLITSIATMRLAFRCMILVVLVYVFEFAGVGLSQPYRVRQGGMMGIVFETNLQDRYGIERFSYAIFRDCGIGLHGFHLKASSAWWALFILICSHLVQARLLSRCRFVPVARKILRPALRFARKWCPALAQPSLLITDKSRTSCACSFYGV